MIHNVYMIFIIRLSVIQHQHNDIGLIVQQEIVFFHSFFFLFVLIKNDKILHFFLL